MGLPSKIKTWNWTSNQRSTFSNTQQVTKDILFGYSVGIAAMSGVTIKGSSVGATTSMDGVNRWTSAAALGNNVLSRVTGGCTWIVFTMSGFGNANLMIAMVGASGDNQCLIMVSPSGSFSVSGTACPTAADELNFGIGPNGSPIHNAATSADRLWSVGVTSDGTGIYMLVARSGIENFFCAVQMITSTVVSPATFSPAVAIIANTAGSTIAGLFSFFQAANSGSWNGAARANGGTGGGNTTIAALFGAEAYGNSNSASTRLTFVPELQGGGNLLPEISIWSESGLARGKLGYLTDCWIGFVSGATADVYPTGTSRLFLQWGPLVLPWDGSVPVLT